MVIMFDSDDFLYDQTMVLITAAAVVVIVGHPTPHHHKPQA
jgi:hypothetical protein